MAQYFGENDPGGVKVVARGGAQRNPWNRPAYFIPPRQGRRMQIETYAINASNFVYSRGLHTTDANIFLASDAFYRCFRLRNTAPHKRSASVPGSGLTSTNRPPDIEPS